MQRYANLGGNSPVTHYQILDNAIAVWFKNGKKNPYTYPTYLIGAYHLQQLIFKAKAGRGLSTYITQNVRNNFIQ